MKVIGFLELLALGIHKFALSLIFLQINFGFLFRLGFEILPMLIFYVNWFKGLNKGNITFL